MENEFPPNSHADRQAPRRPRVEEKVSEKREVARVTKSKVIQRKKPLRKRFMESFITGAENKSVGEFVLLDIIAPGIKDVLSDGISSGVDRMLWGDDARRPRRGGRGGGYTSYSGMSAGRPRGQEERRPARREPRGPSSDHQEIILPTRVEADEVLDHLFELLSKYDTVTMRDLLSLVGEPHTYTDEDWGWTDLRGARVHLIREGYLLDLPRPVPLD